MTFHRQKSLLFAEAVSSAGDAFEQVIVWCNPLMSSVLNLTL